MLGLLLIYFIGKSYHKLAAEYDKSKWAFAVIGIVTYYAGTFLFGILLGITIELMNPGWIDGVSEFALGVMAIPFGLGATAGLYFLLKRIWETNRKDAMELMNPKES